MTTKMFAEWFHAEFVPDVTKELISIGQEQKAVLLIDNCPCHPQDLVSKCKKIKAKFLPANTTSKIQPHDQGIIAAVKKKFKSALLKLFLHFYAAKSREISEWLAEDNNDPGWAIYDDEEIFIQIRDGQVEEEDEIEEEENEIEVEINRVGTNEALESVEKLMRWMESQSFPNKSTKLAEIFSIRSMIQEKQHTNYNKQSLITSFFV